MRLPSFAVLALMALLPLHATAATVTVQPGETLSDIASRYNISVNRLMQMNSINDPNYVESGRRLNVPGPSVQSGSGRHLVSSGETLTVIATRYQVSPRALMVVNGLQDANHVELGQTLKLPDNAVIAKPRPKPAPIKVVPGASEHTVGKGQTLTQIARAYQVPVASLININSLDDPNTVEIGTRLYLKAPTMQQTVIPTSEVSQPQPSQQAQPSPTAEPKAKADSTQQTSTTTVIAKKADWRAYGPLQIDWANWQSMDGAHVAPTLNAQGQALYLAVNCSARKMNATGADGTWKTWVAPQTGFEKDLMKDRCQANA